MIFIDRLMEALRWAALYAIFWMMASSLRQEAFHSAHWEWRPGAAGAEAPAVALLAKLRATPSVGSLYDDMIRNAKGLVFLSTWKAGILYVGGQV